MNTIEVPIMLKDGGKAPVYGSITAAGCDFYALEAGIIPADRVVPVSRKVRSEGGKIHVLSGGQLQEKDLTSEDLSVLVNSFSSISRTDISNPATVSKVIASEEFRSFVADSLFEDTRRDADRKVVLDVFDYEECGFDSVDFAKFVIKKEPLIVRTGVHIALPSDCELEVRGRSGLGFKHSLMPHNGTIDSDYRGEIKLKIYNLGDKDFIFRAGERIAQGIIKRVLQARFEFVESLDDTQRGSGGFGSTGMS